MTTKLSRYCTGVMEAAWLVALMVVPLFFNIYSSRIFEPDKISLLRSIALVILAVWLIKAIEEAGARGKLSQPEHYQVKSWFRIPLIAAVLGLAGVYFIATLLSVNPGVSLWGSYQRLQGTYTNFSYLVIFAAIVVNLRQREQVERLVSVVILTSIPISMYGILQRYQVDPIPWGGDVTERIAGSMGNSIFLAAYLIMVNPFTVVRIIESFRAILSARSGLSVQLVRASAYVFIAALQLIALYLTGSRGPWLGLMAGSFFLFVLLTLYWRKRTLMLGVMFSALLAGVFLTVLNIPNGPLESLRSDPRLARLGHLLNAQSDTGRVRVLIWQGAAELVAPHPPLEFPDGRKDQLNPLRPLIGYGPESMYVAFNPFFPAELGQLEKRNATPDRSHNETWDAFVTTGFLGLVIYLALFAAIFYYGLKWLGLVNNDSQRNLFIGLYIGGGLAGAAGLILWRGIAYFGIGLPFGMIGGVILYLTLAALFGRYESIKEDGDTGRALIMIALLSVIIAHFVEIHFGIAIAATRSHFWVFTGLLLALGYCMPLYDRYGQLPGTETVREAQLQKDAVMRSMSSGSSQAKKKRRTPKASPPLTTPSWPEWLRQGMAGGVLLGVVLSTLGYNFITSMQSGRSAGGILWASLVQTPLEGQQVSYGVFSLLLVTWLVASIVWAVEKSLLHEGPAWVKTTGVVLGVSALLGLLFWLWHASGLVGVTGSVATNIDEVLMQVGLYEGMLAKYYIYLLVLISLAAVFLSAGWPGKRSPARFAIILAPAVLAAALVLVSYTNLRIIQADIAFKLTEPFTRQNSWPAAISVYKQANQLAPTEDYYYLFLGRAYIEYAKTIEDPVERDNIISQAEKDLKKAQSINPLNTDHTANLGRLNSVRAAFTSDPELREERALTSSAYFSRAVVLSPNNVRLWNEWAILLLEVLNQPDAAYEKLEQALKIDPTYDWTYAILGQYALQTSQNQTDPQARERALEQAAAYFKQALQMPDTVGDRVRYSYHLTLGNIYTDLGKPEMAIAAYEEAARLGQEESNRWIVEETIAKLYSQLGEPTQAWEHFHQAISMAPEDQIQRIQALLNQLAPP